VGLLFKNNAETTLSSGINDAVTTVPVTSAAVFPTPDANNVFFATLDDGTNIETVKVTGISSNDLTVVRAQDNTSAAAFGSGAKIELRLNAKVLEMGTSSITDLDGDTAIFVEQLDDEDKIRMDTGGNQRVLITAIVLDELVKLKSPLLEVRAIVSESAVASTSILVSPSKSVRLLVPISSTLAFSLSSIFVPLPKAAAEVLS